MWSTLLVIIVSQFNREKRMRLPDIWQAMVQSAKGALTVSVACAVAGIIVGILSLTGLGLKFSTVLLALSGGYNIYHDCRTHIGNGYDHHICLYCT